MTHDETVATIEALKVAIRANSSDRQADIAASAFDLLGGLLLDIKAIADQSRGQTRHEAIMAVAARKAELLNDRD